MSYKKWKPSVLPGGIKLWTYYEELVDDSWKNHWRTAAQIVRPFLTELGLSANRINDICYGIAIHVDDEADFDGERTPFAISVCDADNIDRFDVYRLHEVLCFNDFRNKSFDEKLEYAESTLARLRELIKLRLGTESAEEMWRERLTFYIEFYEKLVSQLKHSTSII